MDDKEFQEKIVNIGGYSYLKKPLDGVAMNMANIKANAQKRTLSVLNNVGLVLVVLSIVAYLAVTIVLIQGIKVMTVQDNLLYSAVNMAMSLVVAYGFASHGWSIAKNIPENATIIKEYYNNTTIKSTKYKSDTRLWIEWAIKILITKVITSLIFTAGIIYIAIRANGDWWLLMLALFNVTLAVGLGFITMSGMYNACNTRYMQYLKWKLKDIKEDKK